MLGSWKRSSPQLHCLKKHFGKASWYALCTESVRWPYIGCSSGWVGMELKLYTYIPTSNSTSCGRWFAWRWMVARHNITYIPFNCNTCHNTKTILLSSPLLPSFLFFPPHAALLQLIHYVRSTITFKPLSTFYLLFSSSGNACTPRCCVCGSRSS